MTPFVDAAVPVPAAEARQAQQLPDRMSYARQRIGRVLQYRRVAYFRELERQVCEVGFNFAKTPPLEYLASFISSNVRDGQRRIRSADRIFGAYNEWLLLMSRKEARNALKDLSHAEAGGNPHFQDVRSIGLEFAGGLRELFFNRASDDDPIANLSLDYVGF